MSKNIIVTNFILRKRCDFSALKYMDQEWMVNIPLYAVCNL